MSPSPALRAPARVPLCPHHHHHHGPVSTAGAGSDCSGQDAPRCLALALLQPPV